MHESMKEEEDLTLKVASWILNMHGMNTCSFFSSHKQLLLVDKVTTFLSPQKVRLRLQSACHILLDFLSQQLIAWICGTLMEGDGDKKKR